MAKLLIYIKLCLYVRRPFYPIYLKTLLTAKNSGINVSVWLPKFGLLHFFKQQYLFCILNNIPSL